MTTDEKLLTAEEFFWLPDLPEWCELLDGKVVELMPPGFEHNDVLATLMLRMGLHVSERRLGKVLPGDTGIILRRNPDRVRGPDIAFFAADRVPPKAARRGFVDVIPDLVVEIISPTDRPGAVRQKLDEWLRVGVRLVVSVNPVQKTIRLERPGWNVLLHEGEILNCAPVLPDFSMPVAELFAD